jgi:hypothetical protein
LKKGRCLLADLGDFTNSISLIERPRDRSQLSSFFCEA